MAGRLLGIDHGDRRMGLAISDPTPLIATPLKTITISSTQMAVNVIVKIVQEFDIFLVVIGLPVGIKGQVTKQTEHVQKFADELVRRELRIAFQDERLTSVSAQKALRKQSKTSKKIKGLIDQTAAAIILQQYIDTHYNK